MVLAVLGLNHKTVSVDIREKFSISEESAREGLLHLSEQEGIKEAVVLSTCNRTEIYAVLKDEGDKEELYHFFLTLSGNSKAEKEYFFFYTGTECIRHLFRVVSGLDSMVLGESQILNQIKTAYTGALALHATRTILNTLFHRAITTGKRVRTETRISTSAVSVSYAAVKMAEKILDSLEGKKALVFGAGDAAELLVKHLQGRGLREVIVTNRHPKRAEELARKFDGTTLPFHEAVASAEDVDVFITATGATQYIVKAWDVRNLMMKRNNKPLVVIDIAVPCDVDPEVGNIKNVTLCNIDALQEIVENNIKFREAEAERAAIIIEEEIKSILDRFIYLGTRPVMVSLSEKAEQIRQRELRRAMGKLPDLKEEERRVIEHMTHMLVRKMLRDKVRVYASVMHITEDKNELAAQYQQLQQMGFTAAKIFCNGPTSSPDGKGEFFSSRIEREVEKVRVCREAVGPDFDFILEVHRGMTLPEAVAFGRAVEPYRPMILEDPVPPDNVDTMAEVASKIGVPIATGERAIDLRECEVLMARHVCQYIRPDVCAVGGITTSKKIAALAEAHDVLVIPHNPLGPVSTAACLQICASIPNLGIQELPGFCLNGAEDKMVKEPLRYENGCMLIPDAPGIGVELADDAEELYPARERGSNAARRAFDGAVKDW